MAAERTRLAGLREVELWIVFIARSIAEAHGGSLEVDSVPARGSAFRLELPAG
jgi:K+-sensing histidine kinase KdpD